MVNVVTKRCSYKACTRRPVFNAEGIHTGAYCRQHADDSMVAVGRGRCRRDACRSKASFNDEGSMTAAYCKNHAEDGMVNVLDKRCAHQSCKRVPRWGESTDGAATVCDYHKSDILSGYVINFTARCQVAGCGQLSRWGIREEQPTHCSDHGFSKDGLVCIIQPPHGKRSRSPPPCAARDPSFRVKTECSF